MEHLNVLWIDLNKAIAAITYIEISNLGFFSLWLIILFMPLKNVDQRDPMVCAVYSVFIAASAATLLFALPAVLQKDESDFKSQFLTLMIVSAFACFRWSIRYKDLKELSLVVLGDEVPNKKK